MNKKDAAEYLGVSERAVERYAHKGKLSVRLEKGQRGDVAVYDERELKLLRDELDKKRTVIRPAIEAMPATSDDKPRQLARLSGNEDAGAMLMQIIMAASKGQSTARALTDLAVKKLLTLAEASALSGLSYKHLREAIRTKKLKGKPIGRGYKVKQADLDAYIHKL
jgi:excisionase family DNA binding protein